MRNIHDLGNKSETEIGFRRSWPRSGRGGAQVGTGEREGDLLPQQRSGARHPDKFQQGIASCSREARPSGRVYGAPQQAKVRATVLLLLAVALAGCGGHLRSPAATSVPPPPEAGSNTPASAAPAAVPAVKAEPEILVPPGAKVIYTESGLASWYGPSYHKRKAANGEVYDMNGMTAAHRTLPLNSIVRVTNLKTGHSELLRITDRGPFVNNRIIDLSKTAAQKLDVFLPGTAKVRIDVLQSPAPIDQGGRWCVQIGAFKHPED